MRARQLITASLLLVVASCSGRRVESPTQSAALPPPLTEVPPSLAVTVAAATQPLPTRGRQLVRTVELEIVVADVEAAATHARELAAGLGGYVGRVEIHRVDGAPRGSLLLRVPVERVDEAIDALRRLGMRVLREQQEVQDVTDQIVDLDAQLRSLRATEDELRRLLGESRARGYKLDDIMGVYRELTQVRSKIEQLDARRESLDRQATLSTIALILVPAEAAQPVAAQGWHPADRMRSSFRWLLGALARLADFAIVLVIGVGPLVAIVGVPAWWIVRIVRRRGLRPA